MHAITIPYDNYYYRCMYTQELMRAKGLKERPTHLSFFTDINNSYYSHTDWYKIILLHTIVQTSKLAT